MTLSCQDDQLMIMAAHRYCLGRMTYMPSVCINVLKSTWADITPNHRKMILRDTIKALMDDTAGMECDVRGWREFAAWAMGTMPPEDREWVRFQTAHKGQPWPLEEMP